MTLVDGYEDNHVGRRNTVSRSYIAGYSTYIYSCLLKDRRSNATIDLPILTYRMEEVGPYVYAQVEHPL